MTDTTTELPDLLYGAEDIAAHLGMTVAAVYHLIEEKRLPVFKIGRRVAARRSRLQQHFEKLERQAG